LLKDTPKNLGLKNTPPLAAKPTACIRILDAASDARRQGKKAAPKHRLQSIWKQARTGAGH